ncbi:glycoside hydrolase family 43 protein [Actinoplanes sp. NEAU-A12]|uniref:Glycoside hydrolase family 43 protein n=1 Tax=Actinoplanes sandaracinus TaxID=3045177 RepID=A0ABT6WMJ2_9ACTN|nr:glycoside hydrolase family 43 protein [Actinoplanes sandaracinus]MDI6100961.1 glycoside hydrolase family 43 protein [Actinoplanes sandaracinus]
MTYAFSRRTLLRGSLGVTAAGAVGALTASGAEGAPQPGPLPSDAAIYGVPTVDPLISQRADPWITKPVGGMYYFTASVPEYDRLIVRGAPTIAGLAGAEETVIWRRPTSGKMGGHIWAPELHRIGGKWYIYFAAGDAGEVFRIRTYVMESALDDPRDPAGWTLKGQLATEWDGFTLDATSFTHKGRQYLVWAQSEPEIAVNTSLYIAEMANPWTLKTKPTRIATPTRSWEVIGFKVNEGPAVLIRNGKVFITYSAAATDANYCMGLLTASAGDDLLKRESWVKNPDPIFVTNEATKRFGPGHNSFTVAEDGVTDVLVYHARDYKAITGDPLYDPNRHTRVQKVYWHEDGTPMFGIPVGSGGPIVRLSPSDKPRSFVKHEGDVIRAAHAPRELELTQFRFVAAADGTETIQSVDQPGKFVTVSGTTVSLSATGTPVTRIATKGGVTIRVTPGKYLRHAGGRITVADKATVFRLS